jgi:outer membrane protein OmpA-like peptidoglycan-associated protein
MSSHTLTPTHNVTSSFTPVNGGVLQRQCACGQHATGNGCERCSEKRQATLQRHSRDQAEPTTVPTIVHEVLSSRGYPLDDATRAFMEPRFGHDFSKVRVHTDARAAASVRAVKANAYTVGNHVVFASGQYRPSTDHGKRLLAHELTHSIQQHRVSEGRPATGFLKVGRPDDNYEQEAARQAENALAGQTPRLLLPQPGDFHETRTSSASADGFPSSGGAFMLQRDQGPFPTDPIGAGKPPIELGEQLGNVGVNEKLEPTVELENVGAISPKDVREILEGLRKNPEDCSVFFGFRPSRATETKGQCCKVTEDPKDCCPPRRIGFLGPLNSRCCTDDEFIALSVSGIPVCTKGPRPRSPWDPPIPPEQQRLKLQPMTGPPRLGVVESFVIDKFEVDSAELPLHSDKQLLNNVRRLARLLSTYREVEVHIDGHTDSSFTQDHNKRLSIRRAKSVEAVLRQSGVSRARIVVSGFGKERLLFGERNEEEKARNRRVEVWFYVPPSQGLGGDLLLRTPSLTP